MFCEFWFISISSKTDFYKLNSLLEHRDGLLSSICVFWIPWFEKVVTGVTELLVWSSHNGRLTTVLLRLNRFSLL